MVSVICGCGRVLTIKDDLTGKKIRCPGCQQVVAVPPTGESPSGPAPAIGSNILQGRKAFAIAAISTAVLSLTLNAVLLLSRPESSPAIPVAGKELENLRRQVQDRDAEIATLRAAQIEKDAAEAKAGESGERLEEMERQEKQWTQDRKDWEAQKGKLEARVSELEERLVSFAKPPEPDQKEAPAKETAPPAAPPQVDQKGVAELVEAHMSTVIVVRTDKGAGAGFFVTPDGFAATNYHVIAGSQQISVEHIVGGSKDRRKTGYAAKVCAVDLENDLAILKAEASGPLNVLELASPEGLRQGDAVIAIGNPGLGEQLLELSVSNGIISNLPRMIEGRNFLQTTVPVNPGNSGGPLINMQGKVVGVVTAKARDRENINFAVPAEHLQALIEKRDKPPFQVTGLLMQWEAEQNLGAKIGVSFSQGIPLETSISRMLLQEDSDRILAIDPESNSLLVVSLSKRKVLQKIIVGSEPAYLARIPGRRDTLHVCNKGSRTIVEVDLKKGEVTSTLSLNFSPVFLVHTSDKAWFLDGTGRTHILSLSNGKEMVATDGAVGAYSPTSIPVSFGMAYDSRKNRILSGCQRGIYEIDIAKVMKIFSQKHTTRAVPQSEMDRRRSEWNAAVRLFPLWESGGPGDVVTGGQNPWTGQPIVVQVVQKAPGFGFLLDEKSSRVYAQHDCVRLDRMDVLVGTFKGGPHSLEGKQQVQEFMQDHEFLDRVLAVSPDGKWVSTGTHLYNTEKFTVLKELPVPTACVEFSGDSKTAYYYNWTNRQICTMAME